MFFTGNPRRKDRAALAVNTRGVRPARPRTPDDGITERYHLSGSRGVYQERRAGPVAQPQLTRRPDPGAVHDLGGRRGLARGAPARADSGAELLAASAISGSAPSRRISGDGAGAPADRRRWRPRARAGTRAGSRRRSRPAARRASALSVKPGNSRRRSVVPATPAPAYRSRPYVRQEPSADRRFREYISADLAQVLTALDVTVRDR